MPQSVPTDFVCFTDGGSSIVSNGWIIDDTPYHDLFPSPLDEAVSTPGEEDDEDSERRRRQRPNSLRRNRHSFNKAKYYKQAARNIPWLSQYDIVLWIDGTLSVHNEDLSYWLLSPGVVDIHGIVTWSNPREGGGLIDEVRSSDFYRYTSVKWNGQEQPYQDVFRQYDIYVRDGYDESYWKSEQSRFPKNYGVFSTCFVAYDNRRTDVKSFMDLWYMQTLTYTTQDQISFSYVVQKTGLMPLALPSKEHIVRGAVINNNFFIKFEHGQ